MAWSVDRLGRSLLDLVVFLGDLQASGVDLYLHKQGVDTTTPGGKAPGRGPTAVPPPREALCSTGRVPAAAARIVLA